MRSQRHPNVTRIRMQRGGYSVTLT